MMVSFNLSLNLEACLDSCPVAIHEFRLPPKALLRLHAYCPVHFEAFHAALVYVSVHGCLLKSGVYSSSLKVPSDPRANEEDTVGDNNKSKQVTHVKALSSARDILTEEFQKIIKIINQPIDIKHITFDELFGFTPTSDSTMAGAEVLAVVSSKHGNVSEAPQLFTTAPAIAISKAISNSGLEENIIDCYEINEAFFVRIREELENYVHTPYQVKLVMYDT